MHFLGKIKRISLFNANCLHFYRLQMQENDSSDEEEVEPKLKYVRISNSLKRILSNDAVSCIAVHSKVKNRALLFFIYVIRLIEMNMNCSFCALERIGVRYICWIIKAIPWTHR